MDIDTSLAAKRWGDVRYMEIGLEVVAQRRIQDSNLWGTEAPTAFPRRRHSPLGQFSRSPQGAEPASQGPTPCALNGDPLRNTIHGVGHRPGSWLCSPTRVRRVGPPRKAVRVAKLLAARSRKRCRRAQSFEHHRSDRGVPANRWR